MYLLEEDSLAVAGSRAEAGVAAMASRGRQRRANQQVCSYWMQGRGCRDLSSGDCGKWHPDTYQGRDIVSMNLCHRFARGQCGDAQWCKRLHARTASEGRRELRRLTGGSARVSQDPFVQACVDAIRLHSTDDRAGFVVALLSVVASAEPFQTPPLRDFLRERMAELQTLLTQPASLDSSFDVNEWETDEGADYYDGELDLVWRCWVRSARHSALAKQAFCPKLPGACSCLGFPVLSPAPSF